MQHILIEDSFTPIYKRIAGALASALEARGARVEWVRPEARDVRALLALLERRKDAVFLSTNDLNLIQRRIPDTGEFAFERFPGRLVFLHQDSVLSGVREPVEFAQRMAAFVRVQERSAHLCIEADNVPLLNALGVARAELVPHASEIARAEPLSGNFAYAASFVGHVLPWSPQRLVADEALDQRLQTMLERRRRDFETALGPSMALASSGPARADLFAEIVHTLWLRSLVNAVSTMFRGAVLDAAELPSLTIFGGDPAYLHGVRASRTLARASVTYRPPVYELGELTRAYRESAVSISIASPQFDYAVPNRFHDVFMSGGLCLTDRRPGLRDLCEYHEQVSYRTVDELRDKAAFFAHPGQAALRARLIRAVQRDVLAHSGYGVLATRVLDASSAVADTPRLEGAHV